MTEAYVLNETLSGDDRAAIQTLLKARDFDVVFGMPADLAALSGSGAIGVICLPAAEPDSEVLVQRARSFASVGLRVIGIWLHEERQELPAALADFGAAVVSAGSADLDRVLGETEEAVWELADGTPRPDQPTPRNRC